jgi:hypothetical protein
MAAARRVDRLKQFTSTFTMFVFLKGHHLLESYFSVSDIRACANDPHLDAAVPARLLSPVELLDRHGWD